MEIKYKPSHALKEMLLTVFVLIVFGNFSCNKVTQWFCGDADRNTKAFIKMVDEEFNASVKVEAIPCEYSYANLYLLKSTDTLTALSIVDIASVSNLNYSSFNFYDRNRKYIYSISLGNKNIFSRAGD